MENIHNTKNVVHLPKEVHSEITGYYNRVYELNGVRYSRFRDYINTLNNNKWDLYIDTHIFQKQIF